MNYGKLESSIDKALKRYAGKKKLNHIDIFLNCKAQVSSNGAEKIIKKCEKKGVTIEWFVPSKFEVALNQPSNLDLAQLYFGEADKIGFCLDSKSIRMNTLLLSKEYIELNLFGDNQSITINEYANVVLNSKNKIMLLSGTPGSGKSVCMNKLLQIYAGTDKDSDKDRIAAIDKVGAMTMYINLNTVSLNSLEDTIRNRQNDFKVK